MGYKLWAPGELLTSADVNSYLMKQSLISCTSVTRPASPQDGMSIYETDTKRYLTYSSTLATWLVQSSNERLYARKSADQNAPNTTLVVDSDLALAVQPNASYHVVCMLVYSGSSSADIKVLFRTPGSASFQGVAHALVGGAVSQQEVQEMPFAGNVSGLWGILSGGAAYGRVEGLLITSGSSGTFQVEYAQNTANATPTTVGTNSFMMLRRVA